MPTCAVATCRNNKCRIGDKILVYHAFPKDITFSKLWFSKCKRKDRKHCFPRPSDRICSDHFEESNYYRDLQNELLGLAPRKKKFLKEDAVPTQNLPSLKKSSIKPTTLHARSQSKRKKLHTKAEEAGKSAGTAGLFETGTVPVKLENMHCSLIDNCDIDLATESNLEEDCVTLQIIKNEVEEESETRASAAVEPDFLEEEEEERICNEIHCQALLRNMFLDECLMDVTLVSEGKSLKAHRAVLRQASGYFQQVLSLDMTAECEVRFTDVDYEDLLKIVAFIYRGEVSVKCAELSRFLKCAERLEVFSLKHWRRSVTRELDHHRGIKREDDGVENPAGDLEVSHNEEPPEEEVVKEEEFYFMSSRSDRHFDEEEDHDATTVKNSEAKPVSSREDPTTTVVRDQNSSKLPPPPPTDSSSVVKTRKKSLSIRWKRTKKKVYL